MKWKKINFQKIFNGFMFIMVAVGIIGFALFAYHKVRTGHGLDYYVSGKGYLLNYIGVLTLLALIPVTMCVGWLFGKYLTWRNMKLKKQLKKQLIEKRILKNKSKRKKT